MMNLFPKKSKKGITLVESVFAVVILGIFATGILTLLTSGGVKIQQISDEASAYTEATQKLDMVISAISNGSSDYIDKNVDEATGETIVSLKANETLAEMLGVTAFSSRLDVYDDDVGLIPSNIRGWYLELTYEGAAVKGFASNSEGVFDN